MTFKQNWEKTDKYHKLPDGIIEQMIFIAYPDKELVKYEVIAGVCANLNIKVNLDNELYILRIYIRDPDAAYREQALGILLKPTVPIPLTYYLGDYEDYRFAITEFMPGIPLRDLLLSDIPYDLSAIMFKVGEMLAKIASHKFPKAGFFDKNLNIINSVSTDGFITFTKECLNNENVISILNTDIIANIHSLLEKYGHHFPGENVKNLVHADFDPANILVDQIDGEWEITGILDWEFSFSGSTLIDVANMLRYKHHMPPAYETSFLLGLKIKLPKDWRITVHMLNLMSLLDCLVHSEPKKRPNQCADICELINNIILEL